MDNTIYTSIPAVSLKHLASGETNSDNTASRKVSVIVFLDTGMQRQFIPLLKRDYEMDELPPDAPNTLREAFDQVRDYKDNGVIDEETYQTLNELFSQRYVPVVEPKETPWLRYRFGSKVWTLGNGATVSLHGIWVFVETNTADGCGTGGVSGVFDRGYFYKRDCLSEDEKNEAIEKHRALGQADGQEVSLPGESQYIDFIPDPIKQPLLHFDVNAEIGEKSGSIRFPNIRFELVVRKPAGVDHDVDIVLDLGNTRTAGLFFEHIDNDVFSPHQFASKYQALRLWPNPFSGEYDSSDNDVSNAIAESWIVLHELDHQVFLKAEDDKTPPLLQKEFQGVKVKTHREGSIFNRRTVTEVEGAVVKRIPQMFMELSPVLIGDSAKRQFNLEYTRMLVEKGANLQQSSPKRYYWDDVPVKQFWCMILNEWDKYNDGDPRDDASLPLLQGEMLRFIHEKGQLIDFDGDCPAHKRPSPFPSEPRYPRQSTLTWFLLHILERAYSQINAGTFQGQDFSRRRIRTVLMTYPSGWTKSELNLYRERCEEALKIFSETHVRNGVRNEKARLVMADPDRTPDEAIAGQLPFVFSEILRYPGQTANDWISAAGKTRGDGSSVRVMNFDIGGGTTDISIVEYRDENDPSGAYAANLLTTKLLFKDGHTIAGDDLLKRIIETIILKPLVDATKNIAIPGEDLMLGEKIVNKFTSAARSNEEEASRSRIIRTCLIPLATFCLAHSAQESQPFSAMDAGIIETNWKGFNAFLGIPEDGAIPRDQRCFLFNSTDLDRLVEQTFRTLFRNCALYATAFDVDLVVFSGKTSELPHVRDMALRHLPLEAGRILFARSFRPGVWYPFLDSKGYIKDAKTVTVVGAALYYALSKGFISGWNIKPEESEAETRNDWGEYGAMNKIAKKVFLPCDENEATISLLPNAIIARRQNICSSPEPVYKLTSKSGTAPYHLVTIRIGRVNAEEGEALELLSAEIDGQPSDDFELKLWPSAETVGARFWQETGIFGNIG